MSDTGYRQMVNESRRPVALAARDDTPMQTAGFTWNNAVGCQRWEIEINGRSWHLCWQGGGLVAKRIMETLSGTSILTMATFSRPETLAEAEAIRAKLAGFSGGAS